MGKSIALNLFILDIHDCQKDEDEGKENIESPTTAWLGQRTILTVENPGKLDFIINLFGGLFRAVEIVHTVNCFGGMTSMVLMRWGWKTCACE